MNLNRLKKISLAGFLCLFIIACKKPVQTEFEREDKFQLSYGSFENELNLFNLSSSYTRPNSQIFMKEGLFYIANSGGQKLLQTSSFGDLLSLYYNPDSNMKPSFLTDKDEENSNSSTTKAIEYSFNHPSYLSVTNAKHLFVADVVNEAQIEYDHEENLALSNIVLHFDQDGQFLDYIGQEGIGGTPFPSIEDIYTTKTNDLIVICKIQTGLTIYWYNENIDLLYKIPIFTDATPNPYKESVKLFSSIDKAIPDFTKQLIYVKVDYYIEKQDPATRASFGVDYDKSCVYILNINSGKYENQIDIEPYEGKELSDGEEFSFKKVYEIMGVTENGWAYFSTPIQNGYSLFLLNLNTGKKHKTILTVANYEMIYNDFCVSPDGIILGLLAQEDKATIAWWRLDKFIGEN